MFLEPGFFASPGQPQLPVASSWGCGVCWNVTTALQGLLLPAGGFHPKTHLLELLIYVITSMSSFKINLITSIDTFS